MRKNLFVSVLLLSSLLAFGEERYYVCVSSFLIEKNADAMVSLLNENDLDAFKVQVDVGGRAFFRVLTGKGEESAAAANETKRGLQGSKVFSSLNIKGNFWVCKAEPPFASANRPEQIALEKNEPIPLSEEKPYSVLVRSYGEEQKAKRDEGRLEEQGVDAYVVKKYDDQRLFLFDVHAGAFADEEEARALQVKLTDIGIPDTQLSDYEDIKAAVDAYEERVISHPVYTDRGVEKVPQGLSDAVRMGLAQLLVLPGLEVERALVCDLDAARKNDDDSWQGNLGAGLTNDDLKAMNSFVFVGYKDELFLRSVDFFVGYSKDGKLALDADSKGKGESDKKDMILPYGVVQCTVSVDEGAYSLTGSYGDGRFFFAIVGKGFEGGQFYKLLEVSTMADDLASYPQIHKTLFVMPDSASNEREFIYYTLSKVGESYAEEKGYADWAKAIVGHWEASSTYSYKGEYFDVAFFDLDYDFNADHVHGIFMAEKIEGIGGHSQTVGGKAGWFVYNPLNGTELSFAKKVLHHRVG